VPNSIGAGVPGEWSSLVGVEAGVPGEWSSLAGVEAGVPGEWSSLAGVEAGVHGEWSSLAGVEAGVPPGVLCPAGRAPRLSAALPRKLILRSTRLQELTTCR